MRHRRRVALALVSLVAGAAGAAFAAPALADPPGANGTVKIDGYPFEEDNNNEPHVDCRWRVEFFNFDEKERASIIFSAQPPSSKDFHEVGRLDDVEASDDPASGGSYENDVDNYFEFTSDDLDLTNAYYHPNQGYHIKLTIDRQSHPEWTEKHKVFWLQPCETTPSSPPPSSPETPPGTPPGGGGGENGGGGGGNGGEEGPGLPVTGAAATTMALTGLGLMGGGAALVWLRRRRDITFTS
jgi:LPXTG-motif cell wall-anchored protein